MAAPDSGVHCTSEPNCIHSTGGATKQVSLQAGLLASIWPNDNGVSAYMPCLHISNQQTTFTDSPPKTPGKDSASATVADQREYLLSNP